MTLKSIDISNWTGRLSLGTAQCLAAAGVKHCIVRASLETVEKGAIALQQIDVLTSVGILCDVYVWVYPTWDARGTIRATINLLAGRTVRWFWLDAEDVDTPSPGQSAYEAWLWDALDEGHNHHKKMGIYTGAWWWNDPHYLNGSHVFGEQLVPLWAAYYDKNPDIDVWTPFGGWMFLHGKQYEGSGTARLCNISPDLNTMSDLILIEDPAPTPVPTEATVTVPEMRIWVSSDYEHAVQEFQHAQDVYTLRNQRLDRAEQGEVWTP